MAHWTVRLKTGMAICLALACFGGSVARAEPKLVIEDNDFQGPGGSTILPLIADPTVTVLGLTIVTGDGWRDEETAAMLRVLEVAGLPNIPVVPGAMFPLVNSAPRMAAWEHFYGKIPWKGAWNGPEFGPEFHPSDPYLVAPMPQGSPHLKASTENAADFLIRQVHAHPHQVTILAAGPLTNLALAVRLDPDFAALAKDLVVMGGLLDTNLLQITGSANYNSDFNFLFDPEAAHIVLTAAWPKITIVGNISNETLLTPELVKRFAAVDNPFTQLMVRFADVNLPLWDELAAAIVVDPTLVTAEVEAFMDVEIDHGMNYGRAHVWPDAIRPHLGERNVFVVTAVDKKRFVDGLVRDAQALPKTSR